MKLWHFRKSKQDHSGAEKFAYVSNLQKLLFQNYSSPFAAPICKNLRPISPLLILQGPNILALPTVGRSGYGGLVSGTIILQPLQPASASSGGL